MAKGSRLAAFAALRKSRDLTKLIAMMLLSFTVIFVVGVLRPIRDAIALDGLEPGDFYQVYFVSAIVVLFVPLYNRLADRIRWKELIPGVALFFAASMVVFRFLYQPGNAVFGMAFYGWYDLMVAALVTQFFMATQIFYNARDAKRAYPLVIAAGSVGAAVGGGITAFFASRVGTANLLLVAGAAIVVFAVGITLVWRREDPDAGRLRERSHDRDASKSEFRRIFSNRQVQLIAVTVLLTVLVKQFVDYQYKTLTREVFQDLDSMSGFLGLVDAATQWLPIIVLLALRPILRRWGAGVTVLIFPAAMVFATGALATVLTLPVAVAARTGERMFRYSAERTGRELLYVPVPDAIKLKAKAYIDVGIEKGLGKVLSGLLILALVMMTGSMTIQNRLVIIGFVGVGTAILLLLAFLKVRREYVKSLAASIEGRFASLRGTYVSLLGPGPRRMVREALADESPAKVAFALDLIEQGDEEDIAPFSSELDALLDHDSAVLRARVLDLISHAPAAIDETRIRERLRDGDARVRERAVALLLAGTAGSPDDLFAELLAESEAGIRSAALAVLADSTDPTDATRIVRPFFARRVREAETGETDVRLELAIAAGLVPGEQGVEDLVHRLLEDPDDGVAAAAVTSATRIGSPALIEAVIACLGSSRTGAAAREALAARGDSALPPLVAALSDPTTDPAVRRGIPRVLGEIPTKATVEALIHSYMLPETEQIIDNRALAALAKLRASDSLDFPRDPVLLAVEREVDAVARYARAESVISTFDETAVSTLTVRALREATSERRQAVFHWLGLLYPQSGMVRSHLAIESGEDRPRANGLEWLESTVGHALFSRVEPALMPITAETSGESREVVRALWDDEDALIARLAIWTGYETDPEGATRDLRDFRPGDPGLQRTVRRIQNRLDPDTHAATAAEGHDMDLIEKVFLLQNVDLLQGVRSQQLALLASIAHELDAPADQTLLSRDEPADAMYVVISGEVSVAGVADREISITEGAAFGTWALIDRETSMLEARTRTECRFLRIGRSDFHDLVVDYPELGMDLLHGLAKRLRSLATAAAS
ncbi:MAG: Npt1/Npt2 family nucleotide transporter [Gemmatimonadota bacterium]